MTLDQLEKLYSELETECRAIEKLVSFSEKRSNSNAVQALERLHRSLFKIECLVKAKQEAEKRSAYR